MIALLRGDELNTEELDSRADLIAERFSAEQELKQAQEQAAAAEKEAFVEAANTIPPPSEEITPAPVQQAETQSSDENIVAPTTESTEAEPESTGDDGAEQAQVETETSQEAEPQPEEIPQPTSTPAPLPEPPAPAPVVTIPPPPPLPATPATLPPAPSPVVMPEPPLPTPAHREWDYQRQRRQEWGCQPPPRQEWGCQHPPRLEWGCQHRRRQWGRQYYRHQ